MNISITVAILAQDPPIKTMNYPDSTGISYRIHRSGRRRGRRTPWQIARLLNEESSYQSAPLPNHLRIIHITKEWERHITFLRRRGKKNADIKKHRTIFVGVEEGTKFKVCKRLFGPNGKYMKDILKQFPDLKIRVRGWGSWYNEGHTGQELNAPLQVFVTSSRHKGFEEGVKCVEHLVERVRREFHENSKG